MPRINEFGQPIGPDLGDWTPPSAPEATAIQGRYVDLIPLRTEHAPDLYSVFEAAPESLWTYMAMGPFPDMAAMAAAIDQMNGYDDRLPFVIIVDGKPLGFASYLRIDPRTGVIEVGSIAFSPSLQRTPAATEAIYLLIRNAFDLGYRRCEWKCDDLNLPSRRAAERFGFRYEGTFLQATHYKGRSRDTAWYAIIDREWPVIREGFESWLDPSNFEDSGQQRNKLESMR